LSLSCPQTSKIEPNLCTGPPSSPRRGTLEEHGAASQHNPFLEENIEFIKILGNAKHISEWFDSYKV
jgi:hypothetical protein